MITELEYIAYFENLATQSKQINHNPPAARAFFYIPEEWNLAEIDKALRSSKIAPMFLLDSLAGIFTDEQSENHVQMINAQFTILDMVDVGNVENIRAARDKCLDIGLNFLTRIKKDSRKREMITPLTRFTINQVQYNPVGPMAIKHYGYTFRFKIACPFGFTVDSATWRDIT
ncbi:hypothetical protein [Mucilaginibacter sp.]|uniref:hypothetical protein n=1 Tax=Mucilaginibacter sp. TaxID=1882438 RepID=UPI0026154B67|nr:hypothetical protein [Mucilaginibacter sp.]MDB4919849.1 hypothetical protein [Mucilaginibacter sp.]